MGAQPIGAAMSEPSDPDYIRRVFATFDAKDVLTLAAFVTDDVRLRLGNSDMVQGKSSFISAVNEFLASVGGVQHHVLNVWSDAPAVVVEFDVHYTRLDGRKITIPCCNVFQIRDGLISEYHSYLDPAPVYQ
jgi:ketosteroid isomerase-like protein